MLPWLSVEGDQEVIYPWLCDFILLHWSLLVWLWWKRLAWRSWMIMKCRVQVGEVGGWHQEAQLMGWDVLSFLASVGNMATTRWRMAMALAFLVVANAQSDYNCSTSIKKLMPVNAEDPCANSTAYSQLGSCADFIDGNVSTPSAACCASTQSVWSKQPACFCKVTFFSIFSDPGPTRALARPPLCNITDDLCSICPSYTSALRSGEWMLFERADWLSLCHIHRMIIWNCH